MTAVFPSRLPTVNTGSTARPGAGSRRMRRLIVSMDCRWGLEHAATIGLGLSGHSDFAHPSRVGSSVFSSAPSPLPISGISRGVACLGESSITSTVVPKTS